jgi:hypothetical protein
MRLLWRDLILRVWGADPLECPCCKGTMRIVDPFFRSDIIELFLRLHGLWEGVIDIPSQPEPPFDIATFEPIEPPAPGTQDDAEPGADIFDQRPDSGKPVEIPREDGTILVLHSD